MDDRLIIICHSRFGALLPTSRRKKHFSIKVSIFFACQVMSLSFSINETFTDAFCPFPHALIRQWQIQEILQHDCKIDWHFFVFPEYNISAAAISIFSLAFMILGSLCVLGSCTGTGKKRDYLLKPAGMFFAFAGVFSFCFTVVLLLCSVCVSYLVSMRICGCHRCYYKPCLMFNHSLSQVSVHSSHWRWCVSQWSAWSRARRQFGSNTTTAGPLLVPALALSSSFSVALHSCSSPCLRCPGIHGKPAWTPNRNKLSDSKTYGQMQEKNDLSFILNTDVRFNDISLSSEKKPQCKERPFVMPAILCCRPQLLKTCSTRH